ncbi:fibronectin type III domain-containing protein [uncultured Jatrophihabitans sp.]|uniref:fibronectin type III domain-containing protein n=1 Tax=uncultured Jatrophihabitans sp. TaxID=1610747 RepID=UPI0035CBBA09
MRTPRRRAAATLAALLAAAIGATLAAAPPAAALGRHAPRAHTDPIHVRGGVAHLSGWVIDPDTTGAVRVRIRIDSRKSRVVKANRYRADLARRHVAAGPRHGWKALVTVPQGAHRLCVTALNRGPGRNRKLRCWNVHANYTLPGAPTRLRSSVTYHSAIVRWRAPKRHGGGVLHRFRITVSDAGKVVRRLSAPATAASLTLARLRPSHRYTIAIRASNTAHRGPAALKTFTTAYPPIPAQVTPAPVGRSRYLRQLTGVAAHDQPLMQSMGAADAQAHPGYHRYLVLLDIGGQTSTGVMLSATTRQLTYAQLVSAIEAYLVGYSAGERYNAPTIVAVGTNNDLSVSRAQGRAWAQLVVAPLAAFARGHTKRITVAGANDIEPGFSAAPAATRGWLAGYLAAGSAKFVYNGSADGCPTVAGKSKCNNGWTTTDLHWLAGAASPKRIIALPQIYNAAMPWQWQVISAVHNQRLAFGGPLTEHHACAQARSCGSLTSPQAWKRLFAALRSSAVTTVSALPYGPDLRIS